MMKSLSMIIVGFVFLGLGAAAWASELEVFFGPKPSGAPDGLDVQALKVITSARKQLNVAIHELRLQSFADAFVAAHKKGVQVRVVAEDAYFDNPFIKQLLDAGIAVHSDKNPEAIMHHKFVVADGERMFTGSYNLTDTCSYANANNLVVIADPALCKVYNDEFEKLFSGDIYDSPDRKGFHSLELSVQGRKIPVDVFFQPRYRKSKDKVVELLETANRSIHAMQFAFFSGPVAKTLIAKKQAGLDVGAVLDFSMVENTLHPLHQMANLVEAGVPVAIGEDPKGKVHHKVFVVDADDDGNAMVLTGSANASSAGYTKNAENILVIHDRQIAQRYRDETLRLLHRRTQGVVESKPRGLKGVGRSHALSLTIRADGSPMKDVEVTLPLNWHVAGPQSVKAWRVDDKPLEVKISSRLPSRYETTPVQTFTVEGADLAADGPSSAMIIQFKPMDVDPAASTGRYCVYVRGSDANGKLAILPGLPLIWLIKTPGENIGAMAKLLESKDIRATIGLSLLCKDLYMSLADAAESGDMVSIGDFTFLVEKAQKEQNPRLKTLKSLCKTTAAQLLGAPADKQDEAKKLVERLNAVWTYIHTTWPPRGGKGAAEESDDE